MTVLVRDPRDGTIIDDDSGIDFGDGNFEFEAAGSATLQNGILHFHKPGAMSEWIKYQDRAMFWVIITLASCIYLTSICNNRQLHIR